jgi:hypothetical protein
MLRLMLAALCAAVVAQAALADIAPEPAAGGLSLAPRETTAVAMDAERVLVTLTENTAHVKAAFWMRNTSKAPTTLEVGFPDENGAYGPYEESEKVLANMKVTVDGAAQAYRIYDPHIQPDGKWIMKAGQDHTCWYLWQMTFGPEQKRLVVVEYDCQTFPGKGYKEGAPVWNEVKARYLDMWEGRVPESEEFKKYKENALAEFPKNIPKPHDKRIIAGLRNSRNRQFGYVLATGAGWHGPIGKGLIEVKLADDAANCIESLKGPGTASWQGDTITWTFTDLEPTADDNIAIGYRQGTYHALGLKPGIDNILAALKQRSHKNWSAASELAKRIGTKECVEALGESPE